ncbi:phosphotransferase [Arthrobacter sp. HY1533]|uniref:phosphotransferase n=1 Tax=Arthrobacter sp. HY1533 TaxID=2970919 RepID=UPI0022B9E01B|nr:phosphotransferase [Arthrobacter sp. HY1533]
MTLSKSNHRIGWAQLPPHVRAGVEDILGDTVVSAVSQPGGFSPGSADRVVLASGRRAFVKAVSADVNATSATLHRREAGISAALPPDTPAPAFLGTYDDGTWVALALADVAGRHPQEPWAENELRCVLDTLAQVAQRPVPEGLGLPRNEDELSGEFLGWDKLAEQPMDGIDPWAAAHLGELAELARAGLGSLAGNSLVHGDLRADNILLAGGAAILLDWPWATVGSSWFDALGVLINAKTLAPESDIEHWIETHPAFRGATPEAINGVLAGFIGYFLDMSRMPAPAGIPTLRAFQRKQGDAVLGWLAQRLS